MSDSWNTIFQNSWYVGNNFNGILYGAELVLYFTTVWLLCDDFKRYKQNPEINEAPRHYRLVFALSTGLLCMITIYLFAQNFFGQEMWIIHEGYPGGSGQYYADHAAVWYQTMGSASSVVMNWMSDAYFIYRLYKVWDRRDSRARRAGVIIVPGILYLGTVVLGILTCYYSGRPGGDFFVGIAPRIALAYSAVGIAMNVLCTSLICGCIFVGVRDLSTARSDNQEGDSEAGLSSGNNHNGIFLRAAEVIVESMLPYTLFGVAYVVTLGLNSPVSILFLSLYVMFTCLSPQMLMLRVLLNRRRWNDRTLTAGLHSSMKFTHSEKSEVDTGTFRETIDLRRGDTGERLSDANASCV